MFDIESVVVDSTPIGWIIALVSFISILIYLIRGGNKKVILPEDVYVFLKILDENTWYREYDKCVRNCPLDNYGNIDVENNSLCYLDCEEKILYLNYCGGPAISRNSRLDKSNFRRNYACSGRSRHYRKILHKKIQEIWTQANSRWNKESLELMKLSGGIKQ